MSDGIDQTRAYTEDEMRTKFLDHLQFLVRHIARDSENTTCEDKLDLLVFSLLNIFDGTSGLPAFRLIPSPHPDDKAFCISEGENWWPQDVDIADGPRHLHEMWAKKGWYNG